MKLQEIYANYCKLMQIVIFESKCAQKHAKPLGDECLYIGRMLVARRSWNPCWRSTKWDWPTKTNRKLRSFIFFDDISCISEVDGNSRQFIQPILCPRKLSKVWLGKFPFPGAVFRVVWWLFGMSTSQYALYQDTFWRLLVLSRFWGTFYGFARSGQQVGISCLPRLW